MNDVVLHSKAMPQKEDLTGEIWTDLEHRLQNHDWYYAFSDDHRVWQAGEASRRILLNLMSEAVKIDAYKARKMFARYAPPGCSIPA
jgi:hypothetical protein